MKQAYLLSVLGLGLLSSCSTAFKTGQTPDDVYYSPGREREETVRDERNRQEQQAQYRDYLTSIDDRYLRMKVANRYRWGSLDDFNYWYDSRYDFGSYNYNYYNTLNPYWNPAFGLTYGNIYYPGSYGWGWSSPVYTLVNYYGSIPVKSNPGYTAGSLATAYRNKDYNNSNYGYKDPKTGAFVPSANNPSFGNLLKRVFTTSANNGTTSSFDRPVRTFNNTSTNNSSTTPQPASTNSNAGGNSGGFKSTGTSTSTGRGGRG